MPKPLRLDEGAPWKLRYRAPFIAAAQVARANPTRGLVTSTQTGQYQLHAWNVADGTLRQLTDRSEGVGFGAISPDGRYVYFLADKAGNEIGHFVRLPWEGGQAEDITPGLPPYSAFNVSASRRSNILGTVISDDAGFHLMLLPVASDRIGVPREILRSRRILFGPALSEAGELAVVTSTERAAYQHTALIAVDSATSKTVNELWDEDASLMAFGFSPLPGDLRLLATTTRTGYTRPFTWDPATGERTELRLDNLPGDVSPVDWASDGRRILLMQSHLAVPHLAVYDLATAEVRRLDHPPGFYGMGGPITQGPAFVNGEILTVWQDSTHPPQVIALDASTGRKTRTVLEAGDVPPGRPWRSITFPSSDGETIQAWLARPAGRGPFPTILHLHGGPETQTVEYFMPNSQAWLDHGFAWLAVNYRGSTGFGRAFREQIWGNLGHWELEDIVAARDWLIKERIADPRQVFLHGWSYGGYLTLMALGKYPDLWAAGLAGTATVDWAMEYPDLSPAMKGYSVAIFGGAPEERPAQYAAASPMTYLERITAPALVIQGRNDTRTPARPVAVFADRMKALGKQIEVHWYDEGHSGGGVEQEIEHQSLMMQFAYRVLGQTR